MFPRIEAELTVYTAAEQQPRVLEAVRAGGRSPGLDLTGVKEIDTAGVQLLLMAREASSAAGGALKLVNAGPAVKDVMGLLGIQHLFEFVEIAQ